MRICCCAVFLFLVVQIVPAESKRFSVSGYGVINYANFYWETDPDRRAHIDVERFVIAPKLQINDTIRLESELEFEHGGTGITMEFDKFEEFGEFEMEVEKGGEVIVEKLAVVFEFRPTLNLRIGHIIVPVGLTAKRHRPQHYFTTTRPESESNLIPTIWHENGIELFGKAGALSYQALVVNGLDSTGFSSRRWIASGHQLRFEAANAEDFALVGRVDYTVMDGAVLGVSGYYGDSADNRPKPDFDLDAHVSIVDLHGFYEVGALKARGMFLYGTLENSELISKTNRNLSNNLNVKRTPIGSRAFGGYLEAGYNLLSFFKSSLNTEAALDLFVRYDNYDTMAEVKGNIFDNPRWERQTWTLGLNYHPHPQLVFKGHYSARILGSTPVEILDTIPILDTEFEDEHTFALGFGFQY